MSRPLGLVLAFILLLRGESGDKDCPEKAVAGDSAPFCGREFQPKNDVKPAPGDLGLSFFFGRESSSA
ncbi:hypothetical protein PtrM4_010170 [Pyrenophora tritici-repentis]|uniref:Uncharacterized protein n=1 Tax=Pyrenophora tritici-repentis TaxID=45151 RepID=A0A834S6Z6_9PLEO|nr:hypothetical protein A1F99_009470 [Pyrenophora tritici-repentis]KAF7576777.1 hypothetical protein PtrM4_010170 [Pyrenophora tritici-repentis]